jgi:hypothetical protein
MKVLRGKAGKFHEVKKLVMEEMIKFLIMDVSQLSGEATYVLMVLWLTEQQTVKYQI